MHRYSNCVLTSQNFNFDSLMIRGFLWSKNIREFSKIFFQMPIDLSKRGIIWNFEQVDATFR